MQNILNVVLHPMDIYLRQNSYIFKKLRNWNFYKIPGPYVKESFLHILPGKTMYDKTYGVMKLWFLSFFSVFPFLNER